MKVFKVIILTDKIFYIVSCISDLVCIFMENDVHLEVICGDVP